MKRYTYLFLVVIAGLLFYFLPPLGQSEKTELYIEKEGKLLVPQHNVAIVTLNAAQSDLSFTSTDSIALLRRLEKDFVAIDGVSKVESILSASRVLSDDDAIIVSLAIPDDDRQISDEYLVQLSSELKDYPELSPYISSDQKKFLFYIYFSNNTKPQEIYKSLTAIQKNWSERIAFDFTGKPPVIAATESLLSKDIILFFPLLGLMVIIVLSFLRSVKAVIFALLLTLISVALSYGFVRFIGITNSPLILLLPIFCLGLLSDYMIHYFYHRLYTPFYTQHGSLKKILMFPLSLTALSTLTGFLSLSLINVSGHLQLGVLIAVSVVIAWAGVFYWLDYEPFPLPKKPIFVRFQQNQGRIFARIAKYRYLFFALSLAGFIWGVVEMQNLSIEPYPIGQLSDSTTIKKADNFINANFYGSVPFFIEIDTGQENGFLKKETMLALDKIHRTMESHDVGFVYSILTILKRINYYFMGDEESFLTSNQFDEIYDSLIAQYLAYYSPSVDPLEYESLVDSLYRYFSIKGLIYYHDYRDLANFLDTLELVRAEMPSEWTLGLHGMTKQLEVEQASIRQNWMFSFFSGSFLIFITVLLFYRKWSLALLSLIPAIMSMVITFGFINLANIDIDIFSIIFVSIITGLVIDYSIHTLVALNHLPKVVSLQDGFSQIIGFGGIPILLSFLTSLLSFSVLFLSSFRGARNLGFLLLISLVSAYFLSLYLIPLIILPIRLKKEL